MCRKLAAEKLYLNVDLTNNDCQVLHIHNDPLAKFVLLGKLKMRQENKKLLASIVLRIVSLSARPFLSFDKFEYDFKKGRFLIVLKPFPLNNFKKKITYTPKPKEKILMDTSNLNTSIFSNKIQFLVDGVPRDSLSGNTNVGDQACDFKIIKQ